MESRGITDNPACSLEMLNEFAGRDHLEHPETYRAALEGVLDVLEEEDGLVQLHTLPTLIIPDIHARRGLLVDILRHQLPEGLYPGLQVLTLLQRGLINVVCIGDIVHSELRSDWVINDNGDWTAELLEKEMIRSLGAATIVMYLKMQYPRHFHCLRGNHDDMTGELAEDFRKFVGVRYEQNERVLVNGHPVLTSAKGESKIVREWIQARGDGWGRSFLQLWGQFDRALPIFVRGSYYAISHTLPQMALSEGELRNKNRPSRITFELTSQRGENREAMYRTLKNLGIEDIVRLWFHGHTHVPPDTNGGRYFLSSDGFVVRINNQKNYVFAYVPEPEEKRYFQPARDVYIKSPTEATFHR